MSFSFDSYFQLQIEHCSTHNIPTFNVLYFFVHTFKKLLKKVHVWHNKVHKVFKWGMYKTRVVRQGCTKGELWKWEISVLIPFDHDCDYALEYDFDCTKGRP